jgi:hypothetical protein
MRTRTLLAGAMLALLTAVWSAPVALADTGNDGSSPPSGSSAADGHTQTTAKKTESSDDNDNNGNGGGNNGGGKKDKSDPSSAPPAPPAPEPKNPPDSKDKTQPSGPEAKNPPAVVKPGPILADPKAHLTAASGPLRPGDDLGINANCDNSQGRLTGDGADLNGMRGRVSGNASEGTHTITLVCVNGGKSDTARAEFRVVRGPNGPGPGPGRPGPGNPPQGDPVHATLSVSPRVVRQGDTVNFNGDCGNGHQVSLDADGVQVRGDHGYVDDNAREGDHTATRVCEGNGRRDTATDRLRVVRGNGPGPGPGSDGPRDFWLSDRSGYRNDNVDLSVRCRDDRAQVESDALADVTLRRDGNRLTGSTHVENGAAKGWHRVTVRCDGHSQDRGFWVLRDHGDHDRYLDVNPGYGERGDDIDIHVGCDRPVGRVESDALDDVDLSRDSDSWRWQADTHVSDDADSGEHTVRVKCGDDTLEETFFVKDGGNDNGGGNDNSGGGGGNSDDSQADGGDQTSVYPKGAPETGGGPLADQGGTSHGLAALGVVGVTGLALAGTGTVLARRATTGVRR